MDKYEGLNEAPLQNILRKFKYKPTWTFKIFDGCLVIRATAIDAYDHSKTIPINYSHSLPRFVHDNFSWERWLFDQIMVVERHEAQEFFEIAGVKVFDPHG